MSIVEAWLVAWRQRSRRATKARNRSSKARAGWYADPRDEAPYRRWDGTRWTDDTAKELPLSGGSPPPNEDANGR